VANDVVVYTYVVADLLHIGHLRCLQQAKALGDYLIVGVLTDEATAAYKRAPTIPFEERMELVSSVRCVDKVIKQDSLDPTENIMLLHPDIVTHSHGENEEFPGADVEALMKKLGGKAVRTNYYPGTSTTAIINRIMKQQSSRAIRINYCPRTSVAVTTNRIGK